jgi:hypothetical protein
MEEKRKLVNVVKDWNQMEEYAEWCKIGQYQISETIDGIEIRVLVGRFGYIAIFDIKESPIFKRILQFCKHNSFIEVVDNIPEEQFFKTTILEE